MKLSIIGVTGLIGNHVYELAKADPAVHTIRLLVRRPFTHNNPKTEVKLVDFEDAESFRLALEDTDAICCTVGTTQKKVKGDKAAYRKVDYDIPVKAARFAKANGCETFVLVSSVGADSKSGNFYLQLKGEVEDAIRETHLSSVTILRPSMLLGNRTEKRTAEKMFQVIMKAIAFLIPSKYKAIEARDVAAAMLKAAKEPQPGFHILHYKEMK